MYMIAWYLMIGHGIKAAVHPCEMCCQKYYGSAMVHVSYCKLQFSLQRVFAMQASL